VDERGNSLVDDTMLVILNSHYEPIPFTLPLFLMDDQGGLFEEEWELVLDTRRSRGRRRNVRVRPGESYEMESRSMALFIFLGAEQEED